MEVWRWEILSVLNEAILLEYLIRLGGPGGRRGEKKKGSFVDTVCQHDVMSKHGVS